MASTVCRSEAWPVRRLRLGGAVAALAREMATTGCPATEAVERVIRAPHLARLPDMGTIVNF